MDEKNRVKILVADDNKDIAKLIEVNLKFEGYETMVSYDGKSALNLIQTKHPDLIILDVIMPEMDGWQVIARLKEDKQTENIPVILLTGVSMKEGKERGLIEGVEDYLSKPFNPLRLMEMVEEILSRRKVIEHRKIPVSRQIKLGLIGEGESFRYLASALYGSASVDLVAFFDVSPSEQAADILKKMKVLRAGSPEELLDTPGVELVIDVRSESDENFMQLGQNKNVRIIQGQPVNLIKAILEDYEASRAKEKSLVNELNTRVKELSILNEMSQIVVSPLDLWFLFEKISNLATRISKVDACAIVMYDEEKEKFVISNTLGLSESFRKSVKMSLSDPIIEEMIALRRPMVVSKLRGWGVSPLTLAAAEEAMHSMVAVPLQSKEKLMGLIAVFSTEMEWINTEAVGLLSILAGQAAIAIENANLYESTRQKQRLVEQLLNKLIQAQEEERKRMAAEIHDTIAQSLVGILTRVQSCQSLIKKDPSQVAENLEELKNVVAENVKEVRQIIFNLRPSSLDDLGLIPSLENYIKRFEKENTIEVEFHINTREKRLPTSVETAVFRIIQEALTNIKRHSKADKALIRLNFEPKMVNLRISDNGKGFDWEEVTKRFLRGDSHGLQGMKERISLLGGSFKVATENGMGCIVTASIPIVKEDRNRLIDSVNKILEESG
ncbi:MAG: response regulator [Firmicutes bacterium]|nr:response regulator [Bacillota bacterium]